MTSSDSQPPVRNPSDKPVDVVLMHSRTQDGEGIRVLRTRNGEISAGELRALKHGKTVGSGEVVSLSPRPEHPLLWNVNVQCQVPQTPCHSGPARVTSEAYRSNYDAIFKHHEPDSSLN